MIRKTIDVDASGNPMDYESDGYVPNGSQKRVKTVSEIPGKYSDPSNSGLTVSVQSGENEFEFALE